VDGISAGMNNAKKTAGRMSKLPVAALQPHRFCLLTWCLVGGGYRFYLA